MARIAAVALILLAASVARAGCIELDDDDVVQAPHGYIVHSLQAFIVHEMAEDSGGTGYWICQPEGGGPLAFYAPRDPAEDEPE